MKKTCIVNNDFTPWELLRAVAPGSCGDKPLEQLLKEFLGGRSCGLTSCGFAALEILLRALKEKSPEKTEVIIPAYTAPGLVLPIQKCGLRVKLCDVSLETFVAGTEQILPHVNGKTLAVIAVHTFGIPTDVHKLMAAAGSDTAIIEDCAQCLGTETGGQPAGTIAPYSFGSFGRGKNLSFYHGGFFSVATGHGGAAPWQHTNALTPPPLSVQLKTLAKAALFSLAVEPHIYPFTSPLTARLKSRRQQSAYDITAFGDMLARRCAGIFRCWQKHYRRRIENGKLLHCGLGSAAGVTMPHYPDGSLVAFNRFPVMAANTRHREKLIAALASRGIEASAMYERPVYAFYNMDYDIPGPPFAGELAGRLVTLPVHGMAGTREIEIIINTFKKVLP